MRAVVGWDDNIAEQSRVLWRPKPLTSAQWPPDYEAVWTWRSTTLKALHNDPVKRIAAWNYYSSRPAEFIMDWMDTYDPRRKGSKWIPFVFFHKQMELVEFFESLDRDQESGLIEKSRDMGATWVACGYSVWRWLFKPNDAVGWGSRKEQLVDKLGDPDSLFEKMRLILKRLPDFWLPDGFNWSRHATFMKLTNPKNGSIISGEAGDNIGRGGRKSIYLKDESAHYERPEKIESALGDNTNVQVDISSVNGVGNIFHRRRENGVIWQKDGKMDVGYVRVFIMDWRDHPAKTQEWYDNRKARYEREGLSHIFAQEVDRDYAAAVENTVIPYDWIRSAVDAHLKIPYVKEVYEDRLGAWIAGLDVADEGGDKNALTLREWIIWRHCEQWGERDPGVSARRAITACMPYKGRVECQYDSIGVGAGVKTEYNRLTVDEGLVDAKEIPFIPWNAGAGVLRPHDNIIPDDDKSLMNKDFFDNLKAQAWWSIRTRFYKTHKAVTEGVVYPADDLISLDSTMHLLEQLCKELAQPTTSRSSRLKMIIDKKPEGTRSPNLADSGVQAFFPVPNRNSGVTVGSYGN